MLRTFFVKTYGCAMNTADANNIRNMLNRYSLQEVNTWRKADILVLVTCSIRQQAEDKVAGWGIKLKDEYDLKDKIIIMTGCMAQRYDRSNNTILDKYTNTLKRRFPWITHTLNIKDIHTLPDILHLSKDTTPCTNIYSNPENQYQGLFSISHGCNNFCSYCVVPYARGELTNFPKEDILVQIQNFIKQGGKLITLLGQNVNSWKNNDQKFIDLLQEIADIPGEFWINFLSSHPKDFSDELIELITTNQKFLKHCNIAAQSGSDRILSLMNRQYTSKQFKDICKKIKHINPEFRITTDIIVGYPSETEEDFRQTLQLVQDCEIEMAYLGKFSPRKYSKAYELRDDVSQSEKRRREEQVKDIVNKTRTEKHSALIGKELPVLITEPNKGLTYFNHEILLQDKHKSGSIEKITIKDFSKSGLIG